MSMSSAGRAASSSDCVGRPRALEIGLSGFAVQIRPSSLTGSYAMATAEHREPYESRGSRTVLGAPGGESPPGDSTISTAPADDRSVRFTLSCGIGSGYGDRREVPNSDRCAAAKKHRYSINSSAATSKFCGTIKPRDLAVLRLITNSNLVGCRIG